MKSVSDEYPHLSRWHRHIKSYGAEKSKLGGPKKTLKDFGVTGSTSSASAANDDDDVDLFGSDDEVDEAAEKAREERLKAYAEKKSKSKSRFFSNQKDSKLNLCFFFEFVHRTRTYCQIKCGARCQTMGRRDRYESNGRVCQIDRNGWIEMGSL